MVFGQRFGISMTLSGRSKSLIFDILRLDHFEQRIIQSGYARTKSYHSYVETQGRTKCGRRAWRAPTRAPALAGVETGGAYLSPPSLVDASKAVAYTCFLTCRVILTCLAFSRAACLETTSEYLTLLPFPRKGFLHGRSHLPPRTRPRDSRGRSRQSDGARRQGLCPRRPRAGLPSGQGARLSHPPPLRRRHQG